MKYRMWIVLIPLLLAVSCGPAPETITPPTAIVEAEATQPPAPTATPVPTEPATPTPTAEATQADPPATAPTEPPASTPTAVPPSPTTAAATPRPMPEAGGSAGFRDNLAVADQFVLNLTDLPAPPDSQVYQGWLVGDDGTTLSVSVLSLSPDGAVALEWNSPGGENLLGHYARFEVTLEAAEDSPSQTGQVVLAGELGGETLAKARRTFVKNEGEPATPLDTALALGLNAQTDVAVQHVENAVNAAAIGALPEMRIHLEHVVNIIEGAAGPRFSDYDGNGVAENPGDGFGVIGYTGQIAQLLGDQQSVVTAATEVQTQGAAIQDKSLEIITLEDLATATAQLAELKAMANQLKVGPATDLYRSAQDAVSFTIGPVQ